MKIAICMATYNGAQFLNEQIQSILEQSYENWVLYIHDDNSTDNTVDIIQKYSSVYIDKVIYLDDTQSFGCPSLNFSYIVEQLDDEYDYIMFSDQDDVWLPDKITLTLKEMLKNEKTNHSKPVLVHTDLKVVNQKLEIISESMWHYQKIDFSSSNSTRILVQNNVTGCTCMFNKYVKNNFFPIPRNAIMHDWWLAVNTAYYGKVAYVNTATILYRQHNNNTVGAHGFNLLHYMRKVFNAKKVIESYKKIYLMSKELNYKVSVLKIISLKAWVTYKKIFR